MNKTAAKFVGVGGFAAGLGITALMAQINFYPPINAESFNYSRTITTGLTYQIIMPFATASPAIPNPRHSLTIQNNQISGTDVCYVIFGNNIQPSITPGTTTTSSNITVQGQTITVASASIVLNPGQAYTRYFPFVNQDVIFATCSTTGDSIYVDIQ